MFPDVTCLSNRSLKRLREKNNQFITKNDGMRKIILGMLAAIAAFNAYSQYEVVVVDSNGEFAGRYVKTNANTYTALFQDDMEVSKANHKLVVFSAENGQGSLTCVNPGTVNVRSTPSASGAKVGTLTFMEGDMPEEANCLGKENGWYKVGLENGKTGYIRQDLVDWSAVDYRPYVEKEYYKTFVSGDGEDFKGSIGSENFAIILQESENALDEDGSMWEYFGTVTYPGSMKKYHLRGYCRQGNYFLDAYDNKGNYLGKFELCGASNIFTDAKSGKDYTIKLVD